ncbi:hypothetical protein AMTR_s00025p00229310 [Amborella trichopoda]|uniref:Sucrose transporter n=1 Tax=Amborella trichopoda TaxID=13333 RepID=W1PRG5_AMBTC|nr:hypothetical protein AMTR_s00025p00229310 [Amborella trichopoda]
MDTSARLLASLSRPETASSATAPLSKLATAASIAAGIQFGWALQLSLLTPYVQQLGIPHTFSSFIWLCGPVSGMIVQPIVGYNSDRCRSRWGRRRPFIAAGAVLVMVATVLIGFSADLGYFMGDEIEGEVKMRRPRAIVVFVLGFWVLDVANNMLQAPCRALLADLAGKNQSKTRSANGFYSFFMAVGNILGFAAGAFPNLHSLFPFTLTQACNAYCADLKSAFLLSNLLLLTLTTLSLTSISETAVPEERNGHHNSHHDDEEEEREAFLGEIIRALRDLPRPMWVLLLVTSLNWLAWFPFLLFDTDWMGREVYWGSLNGNESDLEKYNAGVRVGSLGLMVNSVVLGATALVVEPMARRFRATRLWGLVNFVLAFCLGFSVVVTKLAEFYGGATAGVAVLAVALFALMGVPLAVTYSIPFALASIFSRNSRAGQGLAMGVLNLAVVVPQVIANYLLVILLEKNKNA